MTADCVRAINTMTDCVRAINTTVTQRQIVWTTVRSVLKEFFWVFEQILGSNERLADALCMDWSIKKSACANS